MMIHHCRTIRRHLSDSKFWMATLALPILLLSTGCNSGIPGNGISKSETRTVGTFDKIDARGIGEFHVHYGAQPEVVVTVDENLLEYITTEVEDGTLTLGTSEGISTKVGLKFDITVTELSEVQLSGVGDLKLDEARGESLSVAVRGVGSVEVNGKVKDLEVRVAGVGDANLKDLVAENVTVRVSGTGSASVHADSSVDAKVSGVGGIRVYGNPETRTENVKGLGDVVFDTEETPAKSP